MYNWWQAIPLLTRIYVVVLLVYFVAALLTFGYAHEVTYADAYFLKSVKSFFAALVWPWFWGSKFVLWVF